VLYAMPNPQDRIHLVASFLCLFIMETIIPSFSAKSIYCSLFFQKSGWSRARRLVVVRWKDDANRAQTSLFDEWGYTYSVFVTNWAHL